MLLGLTVVYLAGTVQLALVMGYTPLQAFLAGAVPFIPVDMAKAALAATLSLNISRGRFC